MAQLARFGRQPRVDDLPFIGAVTAAAAVGGVLLAVSAYAFNPLLLPGLIIGAAFVVVTLFKPAWGLAGALAAVPAESLGASVAGLSPSEAGLALVGAAWVARALIRPESVVMPQVRDVPIVLLLAVIGIGLANARDPYPIARVLILWTLFYFLYLQVQSFSANEMKQVVIAFALGAAVLGGIGVLSYLRSGDQTVFAGGELTGVRAESAFADPNYYAALLVLALLPALGLVLADARRYSYLAVACMITFMGIALSLSRGGLIAAIGGALLLMAWRRARWVALGLAGLFTVLTLAGANPIVESKQFNVVEERLSTLTGPGVEERNRRPEIWAVARDVAAAHPFFGVGVNQFEFEARKRNLTERGAPLENAHSVVFSLMAETGIIGLAAFVFFLGQLAVRAVVALGTSDKLRYPLALGMAAALLGFVLQGLTVAQIRVSFITGTFFALAGMLTALADRARAESAASHRR